MTHSRYWKIDPRLSHWHPIALNGALGTKPLSVEICGVPIVLFRQARDVHALYDRCAHRRAPLSLGRIENGHLVCAYHGCRFAPDGTGYCPSTQSHRFSVPRFETQVLRDTIWIRSPDAGASDAGGGEIAKALRDFDGHFSGVINKVIEAPLQLVVDNMTELEHTGEVHRLLAFGAGDYDTIETSCQSSGDHLQIFYRGRQRPLPLYLRWLTGLRHSDRYLQNAEVGFTPPHADYRIAWQNPQGGQHRAFSLRFVIYYTPIGSGKTRLFAFVFWTSATGLRQLAMRAASGILRRIVSSELERDKRIIERLPLAEARIEMFQLNKFDRPLAKTRAAMRRLYAEPVPDSSYLEIPQTLELIK
jgi:phenylpropionate dioxygenase-like ring-hydroxylating dioxygenase large terminal subunit